MKYRISVTLIYFFCISGILKAQNDSLQIHIQGLQKGEKYLIYYNNMLITKLRCNKKRCSEYLAIKIDAPLKEGSFLNIDVYRKGKWGLFYRDTYISPTYTPNKKFLIIKRNEKLKNRYALDYLWSDEKIKFYD